MDILIKIIQLILALTILVVVQELGHFITARIFKTRVENNIARLEINIKDKIAIININIDYPPQSYYLCLKNNYYKNIYNRLYFCKDL